ncbi:MAG: CPBP family intramembrane glutamic endopeptidase [Pseudomonadales bacterium]
MSASWSRFSVFYLLTFLLLAAIPLIYSAVAAGPMDFSAVGDRASAQTGLAWTSNILVVVRLCLAEPLLWLMVFGSAVPSIAAILVCMRNPQRLRALFARFAIRLPWREAARIYALIFFIMLSGLVVVYLLRGMLPGPEYAQADGIIGPGLVLLLFAAAFLDQGAVLEELGWRGFAHHELQSGLLNPLAAAITVGIIWGLWHVPRDVTSGVIERLGWFQYLCLYLPSFLLGTVTTSIIAAYFVNRCHGSLIPAIMVHGLSNDSVGLSGLANMEQALSPYHQFTKALPFVLISIAILYFAGKQLGLRADSR